jgi:hypothetical protein
MNHVLLTAAAPETRSPHFNKSYPCKRYWYTNNGHDALTHNPNTSPTSPNWGLAGLSSDACHRKCHPADTNNHLGHCCEHHILAIGNADRTPHHANSPALDTFQWDRGTTGPRSTSPAMLAVRTRRVCATPRSVSAHNVCVCVCC